LKVQFIGGEVDEPGRARAWISGAGIVVEYLRIWMRPYNLTTDRIVRIYADIDGIRYGS
jgi:hypothetical protein